jgi:hypothetical protein
MSVISRVRRRGRSAAADAHSQAALSRGMQGRAHGRRDHSLPPLGLEAQIICAGSLAEACCFLGQPGARPARYDGAPPGATHQVTHAVLRVVLRSVLRAAAARRCDTRF